MAILCKKNTINRWLTFLSINHPNHPHLHPKLVYMQTAIHHKRACFSCVVLHPCLFHKSGEPALFPSALPEISQNDNKYLHSPHVALSNQENLPLFYLYPPFFCIP